MRAMTLAVVVSWGCAEPSGPPSGSFEPFSFPPVEALPEQPDPPEPFARWATGAAVPPSDWFAARHPELLALFSHYVYGASAPPRPVEAITALPGPPRQWSAELDGRTFVVALWLPPGPGPHPVLLGLNKCGNRTVSGEEGVVDGGGWIEPSCDPTPGSRADYWFIDEALAAGVGVATAHQSDLAADDPGAVADLRSWPDARWGLIGAWSYGLSRVVDLLRDQPEVGPIAVWGHSRRGKAALWAAAQDPRIDGVWAHQSGTGGAAMSRSLAGEPIGAMHALFPHWFPAIFNDFAGQEARLPVDQHLLLAAIAPRPVRVTDGADDAWADPDGAAWSVSLAAPVFAALGGPEPVWALRPGGHDVTRDDWRAAAAWWADASQLGHKRP